MSIYIAIEAGRLPDAISMSKLSNRYLLFMRRNGTSSSRKWKEREREWPGSIGRVWLQLTGESVITQVVVLNKMTQ